MRKHVRKEREAYLDCGLLCRGFAHLCCEGYVESRLVAFACRGRGCVGRRTAANLIEHVLPETAVRRWVLSFPSAWRRRLGHDGG